MYKYIQFSLMLKQNRRRMQIIRPKCSPNNFEEYIEIVVILPHTCEYRKSPNSIETLVQS